MNCCNEYEGICNQGRDCPIRKQRAKEVNEAFINLHRGIDDPYEDVTNSFKGLIAFITVPAAIMLFTVWYWGK